MKFFVFANDFIFIEHKDILGFEFLLDNAQNTQAFRLLLDYNLSDFLEQLFGTDTA